MKYIKRLLGLPFFLALNIIAFGFNLFKLSYYWMLYGGEEEVITRTEMQKILGVKSLEEYTVITTKDVVISKAPIYCGGGCGKKVSGGVRFCSSECTYAWAFD